MAIGKTIPTTYGVDTTYWRIAKMKPSWDAGEKTEVILAGYKDATARNADKSPLLVKTVYFVTGDVQVVDDVTRAKVYEKLKTLAEFVGATDV